MNSRMFPRTLQQAFGPHTDNVLHEPPQAVVDGWIEWRKKHQQPENDESYALDQMADANGPKIPRD